jgi:membrane carboxypeptidase/penicillin-binding protein
VNESPSAAKKMSRLRHSHRVSYRRKAVVHPKTSHTSRASYRRNLNYNPKTSHTRRVSYRHRRHRYYEVFTTSSFADHVTEGDITAGEDPVVRQAAIDALGNMNGTVVAIDPTNGRILAMVNQKLALSEGATPCSTIKLAVGLAALSEGIVTHNTPVQVGPHAYMTLTQALAKSNNAYFEALGRQLGFERVKRYANEFGLGELAGYNI